MSKIELYPNMFSLSTVGVRNHYLQDYLFHPLRTDFTGDNGVGKSIIADLLQLILVGKSSLWKAGTEGTDEKKRQVRTIPLDHSENNFAYAFLNVEIQKNKFVVIGTYIPTNKGAVRPFIIHSPGEDEMILGGMDAPVFCKEFMIKKRIPDLAEMEKIFSDKGFRFKSFYQSDEIKEYHLTLYKNKILPYDLSSDKSLQMFAEVLQSFSRAKTLNINRSKSLKEFLFSKENDVYQHFTDEKERLAQYIDQYNEAEKQRQRLLHKQDALANLDQLKRKQEEAFFQWISCDAGLAWQMKQKNEKEIQHLEKQLKALDRDIERIEKKSEDLNEKLVSAENLREENQKNINLISHLKGLLAQEKGILETITFNKKKIEELILDRSELSEKKETNEAELQDINKIYPDIIKFEEYWRLEVEKFNREIQVIKPIEKLISKYGGIKEVEAKIEEQQKVLEGRDKLSKLKNLELYDYFSSSIWSKDYKKAEDSYLSEVARLTEDINGIKDLIQIYSEKDENSLFHWAVKQKKALSKGEEAVIMHLKKIAVKKPDAVYGTKYSPAPADLIKNIEETEDGVWVNYGSLAEFIPYPAKQIFENPKKLVQFIEKDQSDLKNHLQQLEKELVSMKQIREDLIKIGYNEAFQKLFKDVEAIENFKIDYDLPSLFEFESLKKNIPLLKNVEKIKSKLQEANEKWSEFLQKKIKVEAQKKDFSESNSKIIQRITEITKQIIKTEEEINQKEISLINLQNEIEALQSQRSIKVNEGDLDKLAKNLTDKIEDIKLKIGGIRKNIEETREALTGKKTEKMRQLMVVEQKRSNQELLQEKFEHKEKQFFNFTGKEFDPRLIPVELTQEVLTQYEFTKDKTREDYQTGYNKVVVTFEESQASPEVAANHLDYETLEKVLLGTKIRHKTNIKAELDQLNEQMKEIAQMQIRFVADVFKRVETDYNKCKRLIIKLNEFFKNQSISKDFFVCIEFKEDKNLKIEWIEELRKKANSLNIETDGGLFFNKDAKPEVIIENIAMKYCNVTELEIKSLLDAKNYFDLSVDLKDSENRKYGGSTGQAYMVLALLCIGRLSIVEEEKDQKGIRFIIIEELANLDDTNFMIFPEIARKFNYQLITMTPKPYGSITEEGWYLHMLTRGHLNKDINEAPYSVFRKKDVAEELSGILESYGAAKVEDKNKKKNKVSSS